VLVHFEEGMLNALLVRKSRQELGSRGRTVVHDGMLLRRCYKQMNMLLEH
jgi:hypothetical protein